MPAEARQSAGALIERARTALAKGEDSATVHRELIAPAIRQLRAASLDIEAAGIEREFNLQSAPHAPRTDAVWNIPAPVSHFTGREVLLASIAARLASSGRRTLIREAVQWVH